jgi:hypothetical protein
MKVSQNSDEQGRLRLCQAGEDYVSRGTAAAWRRLVRTSDWPYGID